LKGQGQDSNYWRFLTIRELRAVPY
jgi:hypothetical protein